MKYVLDSNILLTYLRHNSTREFIEQNYHPFSPANIPIASTVSMGELESIAIRNKWGIKRIKSVKSLINKCVITGINSVDLHKRYGEIDAFSQGKLASKPLKLSARNMGKNDLWIAATASILEATLLTTDKDFQHLDKIYLDLILVEIQGKKTN